MSTQEKKQTTKFRVNTDHTREITSTATKLKSILRNKSLPEAQRIEVKRKIQELKSKRTFLKEQAYVKLLDRVSNLLTDEPDL